MTPMTSAGEMANFAIETSYSDLSENVIEETKKRLLDSIAIAIGAAHADPIENLRDTVLELNDNSEVSIWGSEQSTSPPLATALNGGMVRYLDFMDAYLLPDEVPHPSNNVAPSIVAAEYNNVSGSDLITATSIAYEIHYKLAKHAPLMDHGWDHGTYVAFSSAASTGPLFNLDQNELMNAIGIAGVGHNALRVTRSGEISMWKGLSASNAARNGIYAVMLARNGIEGPTDIFEGKNGWKDIISGDFNFDYNGCNAVTKAMTKKYMAGTVAQTSLEALEELMRDKSIEPDEISKINVETYRKAKVIMGGTGKKDEAGDRFNVRNREEADHSLPYTMAALALDGELTHEQYTLDRIHRNDVQEFMQKLSIAEDPDLTDRYENGEMPSNVEILLDDGSSYRMEKSYFEGHPSSPMKWDRLTEKFMILTESVYTTSEQKEIVNTIQNLEKFDVDKLTSILSKAN